MKGAAGLARPKPLHGDCNKWSAPSRVYPLTEQGFVPPGEGFASESNNPVRKDYLFCPLTARREPKGSKSGGPPIRKIGWSATAQRCRFPRHQITCHSICLNYVVIFQLLSQPSHRPPSGSAIRLCSARLGSAAGKGFLRIEGRGPICVI